MDPVTLMMIAGGAGLAGDLIGGYMGMSAAEKQAQAQIQGQQMAIQEQRQAYQDIAPMWTPYQEAGEDALSQLLRAQSAGEFDLPTLGEYEFGGQVGDYLDPAMAFEQEQALAAMQASQAAQGGMYSGAAMKQLQDRAQDIGRTGYGQAYGRMTGDRAFNYQDYLNQFNSQTANVQNRRANLADITNLGISGAQALTGARTGTAQNIAGLQVDRGNTRGALAAAPGIAMQGALGQMGNTGMQMAGMYNQQQQNQQLLNMFQPQQGGGQIIQQQPMSPVPQGNVLPNQGLPIA